MTETDTFIRAFNAEKVMRIRAPMTLHLRHWLLRGKSDTSTTLPFVGPPKGLTTVVAVIVRTRRMRVVFYRRRDNCLANQKLTKERDYLGQTNVM